jgi:hypothetical protein
MAISYENDLRTLTFEVVTYQFLAIVVLFTKFSTRAFY